MRKKIPVGKLCGRAGVHERSYRRAQAGELKRGMRPAVRARLARALAGKEKPRTPVLAATWRLVLALVAQRMTVDPIGAIAGTSKAAGRARALATFVLRSALDVTNAELARAIGVTRQNVKQALDDMHELADHDPLVGSIVGEVGAIVSGGTQ